MSVDRNRWTRIKHFLQPKSLHRLGPELPQSNAQDATDRTGDVACTVALFGATKGAALGTEPSAQSWASRQNRHAEGVGAVVPDALLATPAGSEARRQRPRLRSVASEATLKSSGWPQPQAPLALPPAAPRRSASTRSTIMSKRSSACLDEILEEAVQQSSQTLVGRQIARPTSRRWEPTDTSISWVVGEDEATQANGHQTSQRPLSIVGSTEQFVASGETTFREAAIAPSVKRMRTVEPQPVRDSVFNTPVPTRNGANESAHPRTSELQEALFVTPNTPRHDNKLLQPTTAMISDIPLSEAVGLGRSGVNHPSLFRHTCHSCGMGFQTGMDMTAHAKATGCQSFKCPKCDWRSDRHDSYDRHILGHKTKKRHPCQYCSTFAGEQGFDRADIFKKHMKRKHPMEYRQHAEQNQKCPFVWCRFAQPGQSFESGKLYDSHMKHYHGQGKLDCPAKQCKRVGLNGYSREGDLIAHLAKEHAAEAEEVVRDLETFRALTGSQDFPRSWYSSTVAPPDPGLAGSAGG
ncbi:hypothetical protein LTR33_000066 [Friedmanniomyces endolithicus]|nr:hypothetical protein LTR33_000066 [Friedmanniomyces endolithicus]